MTSVAHDNEKVSKDEEAAIVTQPESSEPQAFVPPNGGLEAWLVVAGGWLVMFSTFGSLNAFGVFQTYYSGRLGVSDSTVSWIGSIQLFLMLSSGSVTGKFFDDGHGRLLLASGSALFVFSIFMTSLATKYYQVLLAQGIGAGLGLGILFLPTVGVIPHWFSTRRNLATGIVVAGSSTGGLCFPIMLNNLFESIGFAWTVRAAGFLMLGCLLIANIFVKPRIPKRSLRPAHMQFPPADWSAILRHGAYWVTIVGGFLMMWGIFFPFFYLQLFADLHGVDPNLAFYMLSILNAASFFGRIFPNFLADKWGPYNLIICAGFVTGILVFVWLACTNTAAIIVFALLYGFFSGNFISLLPSLFASLSTHVGEIGVRMGLGWAIVALAGLTGTPITGALLGTDVMWWKPIVFSGVCVVVGTACLSLARTMHARSKGTWKV